MHAALQKRAEGLTAAGSDRDGAHEELEGLTAAGCDCDGAHEELGGAGSEVALLGDDPSEAELEANRAPLEPDEVVVWARRAGFSPRLIAKTIFFLRAFRWFLADRAMLGIVCWLFCVFSARIFITPLWTSTFIPVLSPLYGHGPSWAETSVRTGAILTHVSCGIGMLVCATMQLDEKMRKGNLPRHRFSGYVYLICGVGCVGALQPLRSATAKEQGYVVTSFVEVASILWLASTALAIHHARRHDFASHKRWMLRSIACAMSPIGQRVMNFMILVPLAMGARLAFCGAFGISLFASRWDAPVGSSLLQIVFSPTALTAEISQLRTAGRGGELEETLPRVFSR